MLFRDEIRKLRKIRFTSRCDVVRNIRFTLRYSLGLRYRGRSIFRTGKSFNPRNAFLA